MSYRQMNPFHVHACFCLLALALLLPGFAQGQDKPAQNQMPDATAPIYVTARIFQLSAKKGGSPEVSDQVFRMKTAGLPDEEKWLAAFRKTYPGLNLALLQTASLRVFRTAKPGIITFAQQGGRTLQIQIFGAYSPGDGVTPGTTLISEIGLHMVNSNTPLTLSMQPLEVESGMTYYFAAPRLKMSDKDYADFIRKGLPTAAFADEDHYIGCAFSVELERPAQTMRVFNEQQSAVLVTAAEKKVQPELTAALKQTSFSGRIQVRVEIAPDGKVVRALTHNSTLPEMNGAAVAAARQWEFSPALFAENKDPISGLLTFDFTAPETKPAAPKQQSSN
ncbi:MAG: energy transducer TonB [Acidobacteria bacterium]|nr:energy transducer TonB [Acidobacteriota bacterium]